MSTTEAGLFLNQYLAPQLLEEFKNYKDDFIARLKGAPSGASTADGIRRNKLINNVGFHVNNTEDFVAKKMSGEKVFIPWDKLDTDPTEVDDSEIRSLPFDKRSSVRMEHSKSFRLGVRNYTMNKLAPSLDANGMPVLRTTGEVVNIGGKTRRKLTYSDMIKFWGIVEGLNLPNKNGYNLILCREHIQDLIEDKANTHNYRDIQIDPNTGELIRFYTLRLWTNNHNPIYTAAGVLKSLKAVTVNTDKNASTFFYEDNTVYELFRTKVLYKPETLDTESPDPMSTFRTQTYGVCDKVQKYGFGAIVSGNE